MSENKTIVIDLDKTLTTGAGKEYGERIPRVDVIETLRKYKCNGFYIVIYTARNMRTYNGNIGLINVNTLPGILFWLDDNDIPYDEVIIGKPWCGNHGFYVDDRAIRPDEFVQKSYSEIMKIIEAK